MITPCSAAFRSGHAQCEVERKGQISRTLDIRTMPSSRGRNVSPSQAWGRKGHWFSTHPSLSLGLQQRRDPRTESGGKRLQQGEHYIRRPSSHGHFSTLAASQRGIFFLTVWPYSVTPRLVFPPKPPPSSTAPSS